MKLGYIDYLNCYPFYFHMFERQPIEGIEIVAAYPSALNAMLREGRLDMSAISAGALGDMPDEAVLVPRFCLSSVGYVHSVLLRSNYPIEELHGRKVGVTRASRTSEILLKILLTRYYRVAPEYIVVDPNPSLDNLDAALLIGNEAMMTDGKPVLFTYDLGQLWLRKTGYPVVFAVFAVRAGAAVRYSGAVASVIESYRRSLECLTEEEETVVACARGRYPDIVYDVKAYYDTFQFGFTDELKKALQFYLDSASDLGLFARRVSVKYLGQPENAMPQDSPWR